MTREQAIDWAIKRLRLFASHKALCLTKSEAFETAHAMSALTGNVWVVDRKMNTAQTIYRVRETDYTVEQVNANKQSSGSI